MIFYDNFIVFYISKNLILSVVLFYNFEKLFLCFVFSQNNEGQKAPSSRQQVALKVLENGLTEDHGLQLRKKIEFNTNFTAWNAKYKE